MNFFLLRHTSPRTLLPALHNLSGLDRQWSWKTSGAGGEDALLVIGHQQDIAAATACLAELGWQRFAYSVTAQGLHLDIRRS